MATEHFIDPVKAGIVDPEHTIKSLTRLWAEDGKTLADKLTLHIRNNRIVLRRGDTVSVIPMEIRYFNEGLFIWDGTMVMLLEYTFDTYGHLPSCFKVTDTEFSPAYWSKTIRHNGIFYLTDKILSRFRFETYLGEDGDLTVTASVRIGDIRWTAVVHDPEQLDDPDNPLSGTSEYFKAILMEGQFQTEYTGETNTFKLTW
jgi:hypothetical protein